MSRKEQDENMMINNPGRPQAAPPGPLFAPSSVRGGAEKVAEEGSQGPPPADSGPLLAVESGKGSGTAEILSRPLWDIGDDYIGLVDYLTERGGEMDEESIKAWDGIRGEVSEKLENCALMIRTLEALGTTVKGEATRLADRAKVITGRMTRLKEYVKIQMDRMDMEKSEGTNLSVRVQNNPPKCEVYDADLVPPEYVDVTIKMTGVGWNNLQQILKTIIPDQTDPDSEIDHWGGLWSIDRRVDFKKVIDEWRRNQGMKDVAGTKVGQGNSLRIY